MESTSIFSSKMVKDFLTLIVVLSINNFETTTGDITQVSWKECNLDPGFRYDCGYRGITEEQCYQRECCYAETHGTATPWCYHSKTTTKKRCMVSSLEKIDCGYYGIRKEQCLAKECCWQPSNEDGIPWCYHETRIPIQTGECGVPVIPPQVHSLTKIVGGVEVRPHSWPWQVSMQLKYNGDWRHGCGGSIINENWILTAAHCMREGLRVALGVHALDNVNNNTFTQEIIVEKLIRHEEYAINGTMGNDVMLVKTMEPIQFNDYISPICLPEQDQEFEAGTKCYVTGWGTLTLGGESPNELQQVGLPLLEQETCIEWYTNPKNFFGLENVTIPVTESMICAGYEEGGKSGCHGDSGGPLVCYSDNHWTLVGVVSWGGQCGYEEVASVFARVSMFVDWMHEIINDYEGN